MVKEDNRKFNYWLTPNRFHFYGVMCLNIIDYLQTFAFQDNSSVNYIWLLATSYVRRMSTRTWKQRNKKTVKESGDQYMCHIDIVTTQFCGAC